MAYTKVDTTYECPECQRTFGKKNALQLHIAHHKAGTANQIGREQTKEGNVMANEPCTSGICALNLYKAEQKAEQEAAKTKTALERIEAVEKERDTARAEVTTLQSKPPQVPSLMSLIAHCESGECGDHAAEWNDVKTKIIKKIPDDYIKSRAAVLGMRPELKTIRVAVPSAEDMARR